MSLVPLTDEVALYYEEELMRLSKAPVSDKDAIEHPDGTRIHLQSVRVTGPEALSALLLSVSNLRLLKEFMSSCMNRSRWSPKSTQRT